MKAFVVNTLVSGQYQRSELRAVFVATISEKKSSIKTTAHNAGVFSHNKCGHFFSLSLISSFSDALSLLRFSLTTEAQDFDALSPLVLSVNRSTGDRRARRLAHSGTGGARRPASELAQPTLDLGF